MTMPVIAPGEQVIELMIPASKVGLIIGMCSGGILSVIKVSNTPIHRCILIVFKEKNIKTDFVQSLSNTCKNDLPKIYSQHLSLIHI